MLPNGSWIHEANARGFSAPSLTVIDEAATAAGVAHLRNGVLAGARQCGIGCATGLEQLGADGELLGVVVVADGVKALPLKEG